MENRKFCQSCGMPLEKEEDFGRNADQSINEDYCGYCYQNGAFVEENMTMEDMIAFNLKFNEENGHPLGSAQEAQTMMEEWFPTLKRWKGKQIR